MALFRKKNKIQLTNLRSTATRAIYHNNDFPTIDLTFQVRDDDSKRDITEVTVSMTLWEANELLKKYILIVTNTTKLTMPRPAIQVPWGEG